VLVIMVILLYSSNRSQEKEVDASDLICDSWHSLSWYCSHGCYYQKIVDLEVQGIEVWGTQDTKQYVKECEKRCQDMAQSSFKQYQERTKT